MISPALTFRPGPARRSRTRPGACAVTLISIFMDLDDGKRVTGRDRCARLDQKFPDITGHGAGNAEAAFGNISVRAFTSAFVGDEAVEACLLPALALGIESRLLARLEGPDRGGIRLQFLLVCCVGEFRLLDPHRIAAMEEGATRLRQLLVGDRKEADLIEEV